MTVPSFQDLHWLLDIIQSADIGIVVVDKSFTIEIYNRFMQVHSNIVAEDAIGKSVMELFPYLKGEWFKRRVNSVFELGIPVYTTFQQRDNVFDFELKLPIHYEIERMFQNTTFVPLRSAVGVVEKVGIVVYDVTDTEISRKQLESTKGELLRLSRMDKLTSIWRSSFWEECLEAEYLRNHRSREPVSLVMFDIDHLKKVNDNYGYQVGDWVIRNVSKILRDSSRDVDICGRYRGDKFAVILPNTDTSAGRVYCERLRVAVEELVLSSEEGDVRVTISLGLVMLNDSIKGFQNWIDLTVDTLGQAKQAGRNQMVIV